MADSLTVPFVAWTGRTLQDFKEPGVSDEIAQMRLQYYEDKRRVYTLQIEGSVKQGVIDAVKNESIPMVAQPTAMNMTVGTNRSNAYAMTASPKTALSKHAMGFVHSYGLASPQSTLPPAASRARARS